MSTHLQKTLDYFFSRNQGCSGDGGTATVSGNVHLCYVKLWNFLLVMMSSILLAVAVTFDFQITYSQFYIRRSCTLVFLLKICSSLHTHLDPALHAYDFSLDFCSHLYSTLITGFPLCMSFDQLLNQTIIFIF